MNFQYTPYVIPLIASALISGGVMAYAWSRRSTRSAFALAILALIITGWTMGYALEIAGADLPTKLSWGKIQYIGIALAPVAWLIFAAYHSNQANIITQRSMILLSIVPAITILLGLTADRHTLLWRETYFQQAGGFSVLGVTYGFWFWIHSAYSYGVILAGAISILRSLGRLRGLYRGQTVALLIAVLAPWIGNILYISGLNPIPYLDLTPFSFTITVVALTWGIFGFQLIDLTPVARDFVLEKMNEGLIVLDAQNRVADFNAAARQIFGQSAVLSIGRNLAEVLAPWPHLIQRYADVMEARDEISLGEGETRYWYECQISPLYNKRKVFIGRVVMVRDIAERKQAEKRLRQLSRAVEASPTSIVITSLDGAIQYVNPKFTQVTGYTFEEALGQNPRILKTDFTPRETHRQLWETLTAGHEWRGEFCNRKKNGELYWESVSISPISDSRGIVSNYVAVKEDITEQRQVREQLRQRNEYLSVLHEVTLDLLNHRELSDLLQVAVDRAASLLDAPYCELQVKEGDDLVVRAFTRSQPFLKGDRVTRSEGILIWQAHDSGKPVSLDDYSALAEHRIVYEDIHLRAMALFPVMAGERCIAVLGAARDKAGYSFSPEQIQNGILFAQLVALVLENANLYNSALEEISERKRAEALLQQSEIRYRQIVENASDIIYRTDELGRFTYINPPGLQIMGFTSEAQVLGKYYFELAAPDARRPMRQFYAHQTQTQTANSYYEFIAITGDKHELWLGQNVQVVKAGDKIIGFQAVARDITERKRVEKALAQARDQALESSRLKSYLLAKVSHELRTPLGGILGYAELLHLDTFGPLNEEQKQAASQIMESAQYLNMMIGELIDESQLATKSLVLRMDRFSPKDVLRRAETQLALLAHNKGLELTTAMAANLPEILYGDEERLCQILINLANNAIKFTKTGSIHIQIDRPDVARWTLQISDTGMGIAEEAQAYIFEPFRQVSQSITRDNRGTGLGLSITKQLVEMMNGQIELISEPEKGSTFTVTLPIVENIANKESDHA
jgi:PAS domain S-box-containing protein